VLATFGSALPDAFSSDLNVADVETNGSWDDLEKTYQINLDPQKLMNAPAVIKGNYGRGKVVLSLVHFDTPYDYNGRQVLSNLWEYFLGEKAGFRVQAGVGSRSRDEPASRGSGAREETQNTVRKNPIQDSYVLCSELISLGERNFLWFWRNSMLLEWRRGVRGLEYNTLYILIKEISDILNNQNSRGVLQYGPAMCNIRDPLEEFIKKAKKLLILERHALQKGPLTYERCNDPEILELRKELFSESKSHGGMFKKVVNQIDELLYILLTKLTG
jgi:hypothetical protein